MSARRWSAACSIAAPPAPASCRSSSSEGIAAETGAEATAGGKPLGTMGSGTDGRALAMLRLDRLADAMAAGTAPLGGGLAFHLAEKPALIRFPLPGEPGFGAAAGVALSSEANALSEAKPLSEERIAIEGSDGKFRCRWPGTDPLYVAYHDTEWGVPEYDSRALLEKLILDGFQAGLSWITILRKREAFREVFDGFEPGSSRA